MYMMQFKGNVVVMEGHNEISLSPNDGTPPVLVRFTTLNDVDLFINILNRIRSRMANESRVDPYEMYRSLVV